MTWTNISDQSSDYLQKIASEIVPDPGFDDENSWSSIGSPFEIITWGDSQVTVGGLGWALRVTQQPDMVAGDIFDYVFVVDNIEKAPIGAGASIGSVVIWNTFNNDGTGTFTGRVTVPGTISPYEENVQISGSGGVITFSYFSIDRVPKWTKNIESSISWTDATTSSTWTPLTDKTTVWS